MVPFLLLVLVPSLYLPNLLSNILSISSLTWSILSGYFCLHVANFLSWVWWGWLPVVGKLMDSFSLRMKLRENKWSLLKTPNGYLMRRAPSGQGSFSQTVFLVISEIVLVRTKLSCYWSWFLSKGKLWLNITFNFQKANNIGDCQCQKLTIWQEHNTKFNKLTST